MVADRRPRTPVPTSCTMPGPLPTDERHGCRKVADADVFIGVAESGCFQDTNTSPSCGPAIVDLPVLRSVFHGARRVGFHELPI